nr:protein MULTIPLE CHLOROPLAST DIVISION SITE 1 [Ipomoea batatas]GMD43563.1 protein MULTIPLE CHLOROPLAST DIVISION SITE 1 [Ipomoea batatas]
MASVWTLQFHTVSFQHRVSPSLLEFRARFWLDRGYNSFNRSYILKRIELRAARNSLNGDDVRQLPGESNVVESKNKIILIPKNVITKLQVTVGSCPPIVFLTKKHPGAGFAVGIFVIATLLIIAVRNHMLRKSRYSSPGTVADLVRRGQLRSDRRGISSPLKYEDPFNNPMVKVSKSNSTVEMGGKVYRLAPVTLTREQQAIHQKRRSRAYQWKRPTLFLREGDSIPPDVDPDTIRWIPANHPFATTESEIDEDLAQNNVYQKHGVPFRIQAEHEALQRKLEALQSEQKLNKLVIDPATAKDFERPFKARMKSEDQIEQSPHNRQMGSKFSEPNPARDSSASKPTTEESQKP